MKRLELIGLEGIGEIRLGDSVGRLICEACLRAQIEIADDDVLVVAQKVISKSEGRIVSLTGVATAPANLAIQPAALAKEPYRVTVALPEMPTKGRCSVGRTGRVTFGG